LTQSERGYCDKDAYYDECQTVNAVFGLCCVSDDYNSANKAKEHANDGAGENYAGAFSDFLEALVDDFGHGVFFNHRLHRLYRYIYFQSQKILLFFVGFD